tara:strand:- start:498 stop:5012 length:4515 start_codon:yes stop_codon:yes gene_type:complete
MDFFKKEEEKEEDKNNETIFDSFKAYVDYKVTSNPLGFLYKSLDSLNADIDNNTRKTIEKSKTGRTALKAAKVLESTQRTVAGAASDIGRESLELINAVADKTNIYELDEEVLDTQEKFIADMMGSIVGDESVYMKKRGNKYVASIKEPDYKGGEIIRDISAVVGGIYLGGKGVNTVVDKGLKTKNGKAVKEALENIKGIRGTVIDKSLKGSKTLTKVTAGEQISINAYEHRLSNLIGEFVGDDNETLNTVLEFLEADDNKTELENRVGVALEGMALLATLPVALIGGKSIAKTLKNKETIMNSLKEMKVSAEKGSLDIQGVKDIIKKASENTRENAPALKGPKDENVSKLWQYSDNKIKRSISKLGLKSIGIGAQEFFKSRGYMTPKVFGIFNRNEAAKNAWADATENVAARLDYKISSVITKTGKYKDKDALEEKINTALKNKDLIDDWEAYRFQQDFVKNQKGMDSKKWLQQFERDSFKGIPPTILDEIVEVRKLVDDFSELFLQMPNKVISKDLKETILNNTGEWLHTSYEIFENSAIANKKFKNFKKFRNAFTKGMENKETQKTFFEELRHNPEYLVFKNAVSHISDMLKGQKKYKDFDEANLLDEAMQVTQDILARASDDVSTDYFARMDNFYGSSRNIFKRKGDLDKPIRDLLGEIKNPSANILKSVTQVSSFIEDYRFSVEAYDMLKGRVTRKMPDLTVTGQPAYSQSYGQKVVRTTEEGLSALATQGRRVKGHIFNKSFTDTQTGIIYGTQLKGKQYGALNGKFMTEEMAAMFGQRAGLIGKLDQTYWYKNFLAAKGYGQASKTVFNHITHLRNTIGGAFFTLANGNNPFSGSSKEGMQAIYQRRFKEVGKKESLEYYNRLVALDLVNTGARYGDIQTLLKESADSGLGKFLSNTTDKLGNAGATLNKYGKRIQDAYIAEDDLFKIINFEAELDSLIKQAKSTSNFRGTKISKAGSEYQGKITYDEFIEQNPKYLQDLEVEAARIVRNTVPTYSLVPTGIKQLRKLPFGNYFSFPAEMTRTSYNIVEQGLREMFFSGGGITSAVRLRGARRLGGFMGVGMFGAEGLSNVSKVWAGVSDEEEQYLRNLNPHDYSKNSKFVFYRDKEGKLFKNDFSFIDPYDVIKRPIQTAIINFAHGERTEENFNKVMAQSVQEGLAEYFKPFYSEAMFTKAIGDIMRGETVEGYPIKGWDEGTWGDKASLALYELYRPFVPGAAQQVPKLVKGFMGEEEYNSKWEGDFSQLLENVTAGPTGNKAYSRKTQVLANLTGLRFEEVNIQKDLERKAKIYLREFDDARTSFNTKAFGKNKTGKDFFKGVSSANAKHYYAFKDLKLAVDAASFMGANGIDIKNILLEARIPRQAIGNLNRNKYMAWEPSEENYKNFKETNLQEPMGLWDLQANVGNYLKIANNLPMLDINFLGETDAPISDTTVPREQIELVRKPAKREEKLLEELLRQSYVQGGLVVGTEEVPYTKENPADRVDPFTGLPYSEQITKLG